MAQIFLALAIVFNAAANGFFKVASAIPDFSARKITFLGIGLVIGLANTLCYLKALEKIDLSISYLLFSAGSILLIALLSFLIFKEGISMQKAVGLVTLGLGMLLIWKG